MLVWIGPLGARPANPPIGAGEPTRRLHGLCYAHCIAISNGSRNCRRRGLQVAGHDQRKLAATLFHELTSTGAWQRCVDEGLTHASLEKTLRVHVEFLRKVLLHDLWVSHRIGDGCDSQVVGWGARGVLRKATIPKQTLETPRTIVPCWTASTSF